MDNNKPPIKTVSPEIIRVALTSSYLALTIVQVILLFQGRMSSSVYQFYSSVFFLFSIVVTILTYDKRIKRVILGRYAVLIGNMFAFISVIFLFVAISK